MLCVSVCVCVCLHPCMAFLNDCGKLILCCLYKGVFVKSANGLNIKLISEKHKAWIIRPCITCSHTVKK